MNLILRPGHSPQVFTLYDDNDNEEDISVLGTTKSSPSSTKYSTSCISNPPVYDLCSILKEHDTLFQERLGEITGFKHVIKVKDRNLPVKHKLHNVPFSVSSELIKQLKELFSDGIIKPTDSSL